MRDLVQEAQFYNAKNKAPSILSLQIDLRIKFISKQLKIENTSFKIQNIKKVKYKKIKTEYGKLLDF